MKSVIFLILFTFWMINPHTVTAQSSFNVDEYYQFLRENENLSAHELINRYLPDDPYISTIVDDSSLENVAYFDSAMTSYELTQNELDLIKNHHFVVTERLSFGSFGRAFHDIYEKDLPVFISTDAILQALHRSYDQILMDLESAILFPTLEEMLNGLASEFPTLLMKYESYPLMHAPLSDVDIYITMAMSLLAEEKKQPQFADQEILNTLWDAVKSEQYITMPFFSETPRHLDFSQFTVRGHYTQSDELGRYFKAMMWLGRMDFLLSQPPAADGLELSEEEIRRMAIGAVLLKELLDLSAAWTQLDYIDEVIGFMVGESDNLTARELASVITDQNIEGAEELLDDSIYSSFQEALYSRSSSGQKILSDIFIVNPLSSEPDPLPVSFRLMGQRFIVDSYVFSNVVYDRIIYRDKKIWRPMPDPLDVMFVLGNDDALPLLQEELETYNYSGGVEALRYLVDNFDEEFWNQSLYNVWLQAIRLLNPLDDDSGLPFFMRTAAWHQEKLNTQLASWAQLRHDNLLYAKQSYTGGTVCSFPHTYVEPYPTFYRQIANFASMAGDYFSEHNHDGNYLLSYIIKYFENLEETTLKLETLAQKEVDREPFSDEERDFLKRMLFVDGGSGAPPFSGWYADLFYTISDADKWDFLIADVHTQPTDQFGTPVGRVLHVGVGEVNLGVFLAESPSCRYKPMAFVGPVLSYYEKITEGFDRLTDERWKSSVEMGNLPPRPDWVNVYLADKSGSQFPKGRELYGRVYYADVAKEPPLIPEGYALYQNYPNPFNPITTIQYDLPEDGTIKLTIYNTLGQEVAHLVNEAKPAGRHAVEWNATNVPSGIYIYQIRSHNFVKTIKMTLLK